MVNVFFVGQEWQKGKALDRLREAMLMLTPGGLGVWENVVVVDSLAKADWIICLEDIRNPEILKKKNRLIVFQREPMYIRPKKNVRDYPLKWNMTYQRLYHVLASLKFVGLNYDQALELSVPEPKNRKICCIISGKKHTAGGKQRLAFLKKFVRKYPGVIDVYGRGNLEYLGTDYKGPCDFKYPVMKNYVYTLCMENGRVRNYFTEKITDAFLSWCVPIYWGCPNIWQFFEKGSLIKLDINESGAIDRLKKIVDGSGVGDGVVGLSDHQKELIGRARIRILKEHNIFHHIHRIVNS